VLAIRSAARTPGLLVVKLPRWSFALLATARRAISPIIVVGRAVATHAGIRRILPIGGGELDLQFIDFIPLLVGSLALRNGEELLQAAAGRYGWYRCIHGVILASFQGFSIVWRWNGRIPEL